MLAEIEYRKSQGRTAFIAFAEALYAELANPALPDYLRGPLSKLDGLAARLGLICHLCRVVCGETDIVEIEAQSVSAAIALTNYFKAHADRVYRRLRATRADQRAETALGWIRAHGGVSTVRDLQRHRVAGVIRASEGEKLLPDLVDLGQGVLRAHQLPSGRTQRVFVTRIVHRAAGAIVESHVPRLCRLTPSNWRATAVICLRAARPALQGRHQGLGHFGQKRLGSAVRTVW